MPLTVGSVAVDFVASLEGLFKQLDKLSLKLDALSKTKKTFTVSLDDKVMKQLDRITNSVENISDLADSLRNSITAVFDLLDGKVGNTAKQIEDTFGSTFDKVGDLTEDFISATFGRVVKFIQALNPLLLGQIFGVAVLIERLVKSGFMLSSLIPGLFKSGKEGIGIVAQFMALFTDFSSLNLVSFLANLASGLLSITTILAGMTFGVRALLSLTLRFLQVKPDNVLHKFVLLLETLNAGLTDLLGNTRIAIERLFFITSALGTLSALLVGLKFGFVALTGSIQPWLAIVFTALTGVRLAMVKIQDMLLRFRASAGDGRAQTTLFLRALRSLFPILEAIARNAKPIAKIIDNFAKGGIDRQVKKFTDGLREGMNILRKIDDSIRSLMKTFDAGVMRMLRGMDSVIDKADRLFQQIGRSGARDAVVSVGRVRTATISAVEDVKDSLNKIAPSAANARRSLATVGASLFDLTRRAARAIGKSALIGSGSLLSLVLFGQAQNVLPILAPLNIFRSRVESTLKSVGHEVESVGEEVSAFFSLDRITTGITALVTGFKSGFTSILIAAKQLGALLWQAIIDPSTITVSLQAAATILGSVAPLLAVTLGAVLTPLIIRGAKNITLAAAKISGDTWREAWPTLKNRILVPIGDIFAYVPRQAKKLFEELIPDQFGKLTAKIFKGTQGLKVSIQEFFGVIPLSTESAVKKAAAILEKTTRTERERITTLRKNLHGVEYDIQQVDKALGKALEVGDEKTAANLKAQLQKAFANKTVIEGEIEDLERFVANQLGDGVRDRLVEKLKLNKQPVLSAVFNIGKEVATIFASGIKGASSFIGAVLVAPFSAAKTKKLLQSAFANLMKSAQAILAAGFGVLGLGKLFATKAGTTAGTQQERIAQDRAEAEKEAKKATEELTRVQKAEKSAKEAQLKLATLQSDAIKLNTLRDTELAKQTELVEEALAALYVGYVGLTTDTERIGAVFKNLAGDAAQVEDLLDPARFESVTKLASVIQSLTPNFEAMRAEFLKFAQATGLSTEETEKRTSQINKAEAALREELQTRANALEVATRGEGEVFKRYGELKAQVEAQSKKMQGLNAAMTPLVEDMANSKFAAEFIALTDGVAAALAQIKKIDTTSFVQMIGTETAEELHRLQKEIQHVDAAMARQIAIVDDVTSTEQQRAAATAALIQSQAYQAEINEKIGQIASAEAAQRAKSLTTEYEVINANKNRISEIAKDASLEQKVQTALNSLSARLISESEEHERLTKEIVPFREQVEVATRGLSLSRDAQVRLQNKFNAYSKSLDDSTRRLDLVTPLSDLKAQASAGQALKIFRDEQIAKSKVQAKAEEALTGATQDSAKVLFLESLEARKRLEIQKAEKTAAERAIAEADLLQREKGNSKQLEKQSQAAARRLNEINEIEASLKEKNTTQENEATAVKLDLATSMEKQVASTEKTGPAMEKVAAVAAGFSGAMERAKVAVEKLPPALERAKQVSEKFAQQKIEEVNKGGRPLKVRSTAAAGKSGDLADLMSLLMSGSTPAQILSKPMTALRESLKNNPIIDVVKQIGEIAPESEIAFRALAESVQQPTQQIAKLEKGVANLLDLLKQASANPAKAEALTAAFSPDVIERALRIVRLMRQVETFATKFRAGGQIKVTKIEGFRDSAVKALTETLSEAITSGDVAGAFEKARVMLQDKFGAAVKGLRFTEDAQTNLANQFQQAISAAAGEIDIAGTDLSTKALNALEQIGVGLHDKVAPTFTKVGTTLGAEMKKGIPALNKATEELLDGPAKMMLHKSPPAFGPLNEAESSFSRLGRTIGEQMFLGVDALKRLTAAFLDSGFTGLFSQAAELGRGVITKFSGGLKAGLAGIVTMLDHIPIAGMLAAIPVKIASALVSSMAVVATGVLSLGDTLINRLGPLIKETSEKLFRLSIDAKRLNLDPNRLLKFNEALTQLGATSGEADSALQQLRQSIEGAVTGAAPEMVASFAEAGLTLENLRNMQPDEIFLRIAEAANDATGNVKKQSDLLRLIGGDFSTMRGILLSGSEAVAKAFERANKNPPINEKTLASAAKFSKFIAAVQLAFDRIKIVIFEEIAPALDAMFEELNVSGVDTLAILLEYVRATVRVAVMGITTIVKFIRDRYIDAKNGLDSFTGDAITAGQVLFEFLFTSLKTLVEAAGPMVEAAVDLIWSKIGSTTKVKFLNLLTDMLGGIAKFTLGLFIVGEQIWTNAKQGFEQLLAYLRLGFMKLLEVSRGAIADTINWFIGVYNESIAKLPGVDPIGEVDFDESKMSEAIKKAERDVNDLNYAISKEPNLIERVEARWKELSPTIEKAAKDQYKLNSAFVASSELEATFTAIKNRLKDTTKEAARLMELLEKFDPEQAATLRALKELSVDRIQEGLRNALKAGKIKPGDILEGQEELERVAKETFNSLGGKLSMAFREAFTKGIDRVKEEAPELFSVFEELGIKTQEEFNEIAARVAKLRAEGKGTDDILKSILSGADRLKAPLSAYAPLMAAATASAEEFAANLGLLLPFAQRTEETIQTMFQQFNSKLLAMSQLELQAVAQRLGIQKATVASIETELRRRLEIARAIELQTKKLEAMQKALSLKQQAEDMSGMLRGPFTEAQRNVENLQLQMQQAANEMAQTMESMSPKELFAFGKQFDVKTIGRSTDEIKADIQAKVSAGFTQGIGQAIGQPWGQLFRTNLFEPLFDGLKSTLHGLIDGTLIESAKAAEQAAQATGQKFSRALFVVADFGKKIFEAAFDKLLDQTFTLLTDTLTKSITDAFASDAAKSGAKGLGDVAGSAIGAAITAAIALGGLVLSKLQGEIKATKNAVDDIVQSSEAVRGVISGSTTVAIKEAEDAFRDAQRPITARLDTIIGLMRSALGGATIPTIPLAGAGSTSLSP